MFRMIPSAKIIRTTHLSQFGSVYFGLKTSIKFFLHLMVPIKTLKNRNDCITFCYKKKS